MTVWESLPCQAGWLPTNHILFHFANVCLFLSYCAPPGPHGLLYLRIVLFFACFFFAWWGWMVLCAMDTFVWNAIFTIMNLVQSYIAYRMLPRRSRFPKVIENLYAKLLEPLRISRDEFETVYNAAREVIYLKSGQLFEVSHIGDTISLVIQGRIAVLCDEKPVEEYFQFEFVSPAQCFDETAATTTVAAGVAMDDSGILTAMDSDTIVLTWRRAELRNVFNRDPHLKMVFDCLAARQLLPAPRSRARQRSVPAFPMVEGPRADDGRITVDATESEI